MLSLLRVATTEHHANEAIGGVALEGLPAPVSNTPATSGAAFCSKQAGS